MPWHVGQRPEDWPKTEAVMEQAGTWEYWQAPPPFEACNACVLDWP